MSANMEQLMEYKNRIALLLCQSEEIINALIEGTKLTPDDDLLYEVIFPTRQSFDTETKVGSYIFYEITSTSMNGDEYWKHSRITFYIVVHNQLLRTEYHGVRTDYLESEIDKIFNNNADFGLGKLKFVNDDAQALDANYYYRSITYKVTDSNNSLCKK